MISVILNAEKGVKKAASEFLTAAETLYSYSRTRKV